MSLKTTCSNLPEYDQNVDESKQQRIHLKVFFEFWRPCWEEILSCTLWRQTFFSKGWMKLPIFQARLGEKGSSLQWSEFNS